MWKPAYSFSAPASFENFSSSTATPVYNSNNSDDFIIRCVVSASNIDAVYIIKDGENLDKEYFEVTLNTVGCEYGCNYGLNASSKLESHWKATEHVFQTCEDVTYYDGYYDCVVTATTAGDVDTITYGSISINTQCKIYIFVHNPKIYI